MTTPPASISLAQARTASQFEALGVVCPACHESLNDAHPSALVCSSCKTRYPIVAGIPDLRMLGDPYLSIAHDAAAAEALAARGDVLTFGELYASYYQGNAKVPPEQVARFTHGVLAAGDRATATIETWSELRGGDSSGGLHVEIGCGTAPLAVALAAAGMRVLGIDAGLRWLVLARRRAAERGIDLAAVCANAERLPLRDTCATAVMGESVLENVTDTVAALAEAHRALGVGGTLALTTPNRHSLGPDPHLGLLAGGWRSNRALQAHAARTGQVMPRRRLFTPGELVESLEAGGFTSIGVALPRFADAQRAGLPFAVNVAVTLYHLTRRLPVVRSLVLQVAPTIAAVARKS